MTAPVRVLLVDDQPLVRKGLQMILGPEDGFLVVGDCADGTEVPAAVARSRPDVVVFGHTHKPYCETIGGTLFFNPGYAGKSRFGLPRTVAILHCDGAAITPEFKAL